MNKETQKTSEKELTPEYLQSTRGKIEIIGVGCGGNNVVNHICRNMGKVSTVAFDLDKEVIKRSKAKKKLLLSKDGLGAGNSTDKGLTAAKSKEDAISNILNDDIPVCFIVSCFGGGTGTGVAPFVASKAKELGKTTVGIVTLPFGFEGNKKFTQALSGINGMAKNSDYMFILNNQSILDNNPENSLLNTFENFDNKVYEIIKSIATLLFPLPEENKPKMSFIKNWFKAITNNN